MSTDRLDAKNIVFHRGTRRVLDCASLTLASGEIVCLLGRNGAGKTTLMRIMMGFLKPDHGAVCLDDRLLSGYSRRALALRLAYVPQEHLPPFPYLVREVLAMGRMPATGLFGRATKEDGVAVEEVLDSLEIGHLAERRYTELSGGERQLVMIGRALAQQARLLVMDEPFSGLDYGHQMELIARLRRLRERGYGILLTTHQPDLAFLLATRVGTLVNGCIEDDGPPQDIIVPDTIRRIYGVEMHSFGCTQSS